jgi:hypothetical protein
MKIHCVCRITILFLGAFFTILQSESSAAPCATKKLSDKYLAAFRQQRLTSQASPSTSKSLTLRRRAAGAIAIPVYVHIFAKDRTLAGGYVSDAMITDQMGVLNRSFAGVYGGGATPFTFNLVSINRVISRRLHTAPLTGDSASSVHKHIARTYRRGSTNALNIYIAYLKRSALGFTFFAPGNYLDGMFLDFRTLPGYYTDPAQIAVSGLGFVTVHETGHWLGLDHTFEGGCSSRNDYVSDTPAERSPARGCPIGRDSCKGTRYAGVDPIHNFMDYTYDSCQNNFTALQSERMEFYSERYRGL